MTIRRLRPCAVVSAAVLAWSTAGCATRSPPQAVAADARPAATAEVLALVDRAVAAHGGLEALRRVAARREQGHVRALVRGMEGDATRTWARPRRLKVVIDYPGAPEVRLVDGDHGWRRDGAGGFVEVQGPLLGSMALQALRSDLPWLLAERREEVTLGGQETVAGRVQVRLDLTVPGGTVSAYLDQQTGLVVRSASRLASPELTTVFETRYSDFRTVDGVFLPFAEETWVSGQHTASLSLTHIEVNPALPEDAFLPTR